jgi:hypothetical protein
MSDYWDQETRQFRQEGSGFTREEQAAFERGREKATAHLAEMRATPSLPGRVVTVPERERPRVTVLGTHPVAGRHREYEAWRRTPGGRFHSLAYPDPAEAYEEHERETGPEAVREVQDTWEVRYGRRPAAAAVQAMLNARHWDRGQGFEGTAQELQDTSRWNWPDWPVFNRGEDPLVIEMGAARLVQRP